MKKIVTLLGVAALVLGILPIVSASGDSMKVILLVDDRDYNVGDYVTVTVHVFDYGTHVDADTITITVGSYPNQREIYPSKTGTGVYQGTFWVQSSDVSYGSVSIRASATHWGHSDNDYEWIDVSTVSVTIDVSNYKTSPGDTITITVTVKDGTTKVDADNLTISVSKYVMGGSAAEEELTYDRISTGVYRATYIIDPTIAQDASFSVRAKATYNNQYEYGYAGFFIDFQDVYEIWYHELSVTTSKAEFELWVSDRNGDVVPGVSIDLTYKYYDENYKTITKEVSKTTDASGKAIFTINYYGAKWFVEIYGTVTLSDKSQQFRGYISLEYERTGFYVSQDRELFLLPLPGDLININYTAYDGEIPLSNHKIYYYIHTDSELIKNGIITTDTNGKFNLHFIMPNDDVEIEFQTEIGGSYEETTDYVSVMLGTLDITVGTLYVGCITNLTVSSPTTEEFIGMAVCVPYEPSAYIYGLSWQKLSGFGYGTLLEKTNGEYKGTIIIPDFMPKNRDYIIVVWMYSIGYYYGGYANFLLVNISNVLPVANLTADLAETSTHEEVTFDATLSTDLDGNIVEYYFDFGDGESSGWVSTPNIAHTYKESGTYTAKLKVKDNDGTESEWDMVQITVKEKKLIEGFFGIGAQTFWLIIVLVIVSIIIITAVGLAFKYKRRVSPQPPSPIQQVTSLEYCPSCGNKLQLGWKVCGYCGRKLGA